MAVDPKIAEEIIRLRLSMMLVNEKYKNGEFKIPIHLALGHEAIAVAVSAVMGVDDQIAASHRNAHYNLARISTLKPLLDEYFLQESGLGGARMGSMNLAGKDTGIAYASSILGNNLPVASGLALANRVTHTDGVVFVVTGDGAMEEGSFYETVSFLKSQDLCGIIIVENNEWSMATQIHERRCDIHLDRFASAFDVPYLLLEGNDTYNYVASLTALRSQVLKENTPAIVEVKMQTLGDWRLKTDDFPDGKFINYHAGPSPSVDVLEWPVIQDSDVDPVFVLMKHFEQDHLKTVATNVLSRLKEEIA